MCGIAIFAGNAANQSLDLVKGMLRSIAHRGPDGDGLKAYDGCILGHQRLSIIDLRSGSQPMTVDEGRYSITFNGEIYNYREIREQLRQRGVDFKTDSDTEVILRAYQQFGVDCLSILRGMFAFAIWDSKEKILFGARDLFGEKPFFYSQSNDGDIIICSEIKGILSTKPSKWDVDLTSIDAYIALGYVPPNRTVYQDISVLPPSHYIQWQGGKTRIVRYWQPQFNESRLSLSDAEEKLRFLVSNAVRRQMVADVPVGAFLSGGLDSSTVVAMMREHNQSQIDTFSVGFGVQNSELPFASEVSMMYKTQHHELDIENVDVADLLIRLSGVYDEPFADSSNIPTFLVSQLASKYVKVVLTGDGADELFGGYTWGYPQLINSNNVPRSQLLWLVMRSLSRLMNDRIEKFALYSQSLGIALHGDDVWSRRVHQSIHFSNKERAILWNGRIDAPTAYYPGQFFTSPKGVKGLNEALYFDLTSYLPGDILTKVDRASMHHGLETRAPFLDKDLVEFALSLPAIYKVQDYKTKVIMHNSLAQYWPESIRGRKKQGFGGPIPNWLKLPKVRELTKLVSAENTPLRKMLPGLENIENYSDPYKQWILLVLGVWLHQRGIN
jgi:asparagine synthase (glutamine-hydrolysing)